MLNSLEIHGYRGFPSYRLSDLTRVNLVVGKNNCGKTSILEAIEVLVSGGSPSVIYRLGRERRKVNHPIEVRRYSGGWAMDFSHVFHGHSFFLGSSLVFNSNDGERYVEIKVEELNDIDEDFPWSQFAQEEDNALAFAFELRIHSSTLSELVRLPMMEDGTVIFNPRSAAMRDRYQKSPARFLSVDSSDPATMGEPWNSVLEDSLEGEIIDDMKTLVPSLNSIHFLTGSQFGKGILLDLNDGTGRVPISTFGDGLRRLLALRLSFVGAGNGFLLVDEIDTGLHWTVMEDMWRFVVEVACRNSVQIFATTHSYDCIRGLGSLIQSRADLADQVCIQKVDPLLDQAVCFRDEQIKVAIEQEIEVR